MYLVEYGKPGTCSNPNVDDSQGFVEFKCSACGATTSYNYTDFPKVTDTYVQLKPNQIVKCRKCGHRATDTIITRQPPEQEQSTATEEDLHIVHCPVCNSRQVEKISLASKAGRAVAFGLFSASYLGKTYKCKTCGYKF